MILHLPHASTLIPPEFREQFLLSDEELSAELIALTDLWTDELFTCPDVTRIRFDYSRLLVDVERFRDDLQEPMFDRGMGALYMRTHDGNALRRQLETSDRRHLLRIYDDHHQRLTDAVAGELHSGGCSLIVDCHSFPHVPLACDLNQERPRPDICLGTDSFHTPKHLVDQVEKMFVGFGFSVTRNVPYAGTIVPLEFLNRNSNVSSLMIEVNRQLYMNESTGAKIPRFSQIQGQISSVLTGLLKSVK